MSETQKVIGVFVAAPGDIAEERSVIESVIQDWNTHRGRPAGARADVVWWRNRARPRMGSTFAPDLSKLDAFMPKVKKEFSDRDRIQFLEGGFREIHDFMRAALSRLAETESSIEADFRDITSVHFACRVYRHGDLVSQCKIWIGRQLGSMGIYYSGDDVETPAYNSFNDWLTLDDDGHELFFKPSGFAMSFGGQQSSKLSAEDAGTHYWRKLTEYLGSR